MGRQAHPAAYVIGGTLGILVGAFLLAGLVWLALLIAKTRMASVHFMCCFSVGIIWLMGSQVVLVVMDTKTPVSTRARAPLQEQPIVEVRPAAEMAVIHPEPTVSRPVNEPVRLWRQKHPEDLRTDDQITQDLAWKNPDAFNTYPDAVADFRRVLAKEYTLLSQGAKAYDASNPAHVWLVDFVLEQERGIEARAEWDPNGPVKNGKLFLPRCEYAPMARTNAVTAKIFWSLSDDDVLQALARLGGVPKRVVTNEVVKEVRVPADLTETQQSAVDLAARYSTAPTVRKKEGALYKLVSVRVIFALSEDVKGVVSEARIRDRFELTLRRHNVPIDPSSPAFLLASFDGFWTPDRHLLPYSYHVELDDVATLERKGDLRRVNAVVWDLGGVGYAGKDVAERVLLDLAEEMAEAFANPYLQAQDSK